MVVFPTQTRYVIGGRADRDEVFDKIKSITENVEDTSQIIVPDFDFIEEHFLIDENIKKELYSKLPNIHSYILKANDDNLKLSKSLFDENNEVGISICNNFIQDIVYSLRLPIFITQATKFQIDKEPRMFENISSELLKQADLIIIDDISVLKKNPKIFEFKKVDNTFKLFEKK